jgi:4-amino-4-deoxy-L-arabinose transferase-like glycosyltransferase
MRDHLDLPTELRRRDQPHNRAAEGCFGLVPLAWVVILAVVLRAVAWFYFDPVTFDSALYFEMAALIREGRWAEALAYDYPPLYPLLIAGLQSVVGSGDTAGLLIAAVADLAILIPIVAIARIAAGEAAAWGAAFLWVVHLSAIRLGVQALSDAPTALCVAVALYAGLRALDRRRLRWAWGAGMASGLAFLFRPEGIEPAIALAVFYAFYGHRAVVGPAETHDALFDTRGSRLAARNASLALPPSSRSGRAIRRVGWVLAPLAGWALVTGPYIAYISAEAGSLTLSKKKSAASIVRSSVPLPVFTSPTPNPQPPVPSPQSPADRKGAPFSGQDSVRRLWASVDAFQQPLVNGLNPLLILTGAVGLGGIFRRRAERWNRTYALLSGLFILHLVILVGLAAQAGPTYLGRHHFLLMVVYALPAAGAGLAWTVGWVEARFPAQGWVSSAALGLVVVATVLAVVTRGPDQGRSLREAAVWIRSQVAGTPIIVTRLAKLTYHANAERVDIAGTYDEILRRGRDRSAHFVALYPDLVRLTSPDFLDRLPSPDLELVKVFPEPSRTAPDQRLEIYRIR